MRVGILGAGAVGGFVGAKLMHHGTRVTFVGRARGKADAEMYGLRIEALDGASFVAPPTDLDYQVDPAALAPCDAVLCAVKSAQTAAAGKELAEVLRDDALVVSLQNGLHNADILRAALPRRTVLAAIVEFNVVAAASNVFRRATSGGLVIQAHGDPRASALVEALRTADLPTKVPADIRAAQWSKLVMNLTNAIGALSGAPTRDVLFDAGYRRVVRAVMSEAISVLRAAKVKTARLGPLPVAAFPTLLGLPTSVFEIVAGAQLRVDPEARSSMWQDLDKRRTTEVEELNGEIVRLAKSTNVQAPINARVVEQVHQAEVAAAGSPNLSPGELAAQLGLTSGAT